MSRYTVAAIEPARSDLGEDAPSCAGSPGTVPGSDASLLERFQKGENAALVELFDRHNRRLFIYCMKILGSREGAKDVTQEMWERVLRLRGSSMKVANPVGFLLKIARNLCLNHIESRRSRGYHASLATLPESAHPAAPEHSQVEELILASLECLSFEHREVLILNTYCGYRMEEIAAMIGKSPEAVWKRASRARKELREIVMREDRTKGMRRNR